MLPDPDNTGYNGGINLEWEACPLQGNLMEYLFEFQYIITEDNTTDKEFCRYFEGKGALKT